MNLFDLSAAQGAIEKFMVDVQSGIAKLQSHVREAHNLQFKLLLNLDARLAALESAAGLQPFNAGKVGGLTEPASVPSATTTKMP